MKRFYFLLFSLAILDFSCSKDSLPDDGFSPDLSLQKMLRAAKGAVINLSPSEDGDDTDELLAAFESAKAAGPGSTVQLAEGEYHIGFILAEDFIGSFNGAGMGKTIISPLPDLASGNLYALNLAPELVKFLRGDVKISNMSFRILDGEPLPGDALWAYLALHDWAHTELPGLPVNHKITAVVDHVEFVGSLATNSWSKYTVQQAVGIGPDFVWDENIPYSNTDITITNCIVNDVWMAFGNLGIEKGRTIFSNNGPIKAEIGIWLIDNIGGSTLISGNIFNTMAWGESVRITNAVYNLNEFKLSEGCQYEISGNTFHTTDAWGAITIANDRKAIGIFDNKNPVSVLIKSNLFDLKGSSWAGIWNWITDDAIIRNNNFIGQAKTAVYVDSRTNNSLMLGNNFSNLVCSQLDFLPLGIGYNILLLGNNNTVVGDNDRRTTVLNLGENNLINGAKFVNKEPLGQTIADNYKIWKENLVKMRIR